MAERKRKSKKDDGVRIVATSDLHGELDGLERYAIGADVLVIAGDIQPARIGVDVPRWFTEEFYPLMGKLGCEVVAIPGNHDFHLSRCLASADGKGMDGAPPNFHLLMPDSGIEVKGIYFWGTPWCPWIDGRWCFEREDADLLDYFRQIPSLVDVLITHTPPKIPKGDGFANLDASTQYDARYWRHFGSESLYTAMKAKLPSVVVSGHIHSGDHEPYGAMMPKKQCVCMNVSRLNENYKIAYKPTRFRLTDGAVVIEEYGKEENDIAALMRKNTAENPVFP